MYGYFIYIYVCVPRACLVPMEEEEGIRVPELELVVTWGLNQGPLEKQPVHSTAEAPLQPLEVEFF